MNLKEAGLSFEEVVNALFVQYLAVCSLSLAFTFMARFPVKLIPKTFFAESRGRKAVWIRKDGHGSNLI